jgi:hypothetical protein
VDDLTSEPEPVSPQTLSNAAHRARHFLALISTLCLFVVG